MTKPRPKTAVQLIETHDLEARRSTIPTSCWIPTAAASPEGRLPVALPRSMDAVVASPTDEPIGGDGALFPHGAGLALDRDDGA